MYRDSVLLVEKNNTSKATSGQYSVTRYWRNPFKKSIESQFIFDTFKGPYISIEVFDDFAIVLK